MRRKNLSTRPNKSQQSQTEHVILDADYCSGMTASDIRLRNLIRHKVSKMRSREQIEKLAKYMGITI